MKISEFVYASITPRFGAQSPTAHSASLYGTAYNVIGHNGVHSDLSPLRFYVDKVTVFDAALLSI